MGMLPLKVALLALVLSTAAQAAEVDGKAIYDRRCSFCHGAEGRGDGPAGSALKPPPTSFADPAYAKNATPERIRDVISQGRQGTAMLPFGQTLKPEEIDAVARYVLGLAPK